MRLESFSAPRSVVPVVFVALLVPAIAGAEQPHVHNRPAATGAASASAGVATVAPANALARARTLYTLGVDHIESKQWKQAYAALSEAWDLKRHWQVALMLGWAEMELGKVRAAIAHLTFASTDKEPKDSEYTRRISALLREAEPRLAHLRIVGVPAGAKVLVDGEVVAIAPLPDPVSVDPGTRTVTAALGSRIVSQSVTVSSSAPEPGKSNETPTVTFVWPADTAPGAAGSAMTRPSAGETAPSLVPAAVLGVSGVVALGAGFGLFALSEARGGEATAARRTYDDLAAGQKTDSAKKVVGDLLREQDALLTGATIAWIGAAALGAGAVGYSLYRAGARKTTARQSSASKATLQWLPALSPQGAGVVVQGSF